MGIEPTLLAWEAKVLPLNYTRLVWALLYAFFHLNQRSKQPKHHIPVRLHKL